MLEIERLYQRNKKFECFLIHKCNLAFQNPRNRSKNHQRTKDLLQMDEHQAIENAVHIIIDAAQKLQNLFSTFGEHVGNKLLKQNLTNRI